MAQFPEIITMRVPSSLPPVSRLHPGPVDPPSWDVVDRVTSELVRDPFAHATDLSATRFLPTSHSSTEIVSEAVAAGADLAKLSCAFEVHRAVACGAAASVALWDHDRQMVRRSKRRLGHGLASAAATRSATRRGSVATLGAERRQPGRLSKPSPALTRQARLRNGTSPAAAPSQTRGRPQRGGQRMPTGGRLRARPWHRWNPFEPRSKRSLTAMLY